MLIDWGYETRLIDRIAVRQAAAALTSRERRVLTRYYGRDETLDEVGKHEGVTKERVRQLITHAIPKLQARIAAEPLRPTARTTPPPGFDKQAFLRHMRGLIEQRETLARERIAEREAYERDVYARERKSLDAIMRREELAGLFDPPPPPKPKLPPPPYVPPKPLPYVPAAAPAQHVEPWFNPARQPTVGDMRCIAQYALGYLLAILPPQQYGSGTMGTHAAHVICARDADAIATAMQSLKRAMPNTARLSAVKLDVPKDLLAASIGDHRGAIRVASLDSGRQVSLEVTWT